MTYPAQHSDIRPFNYNAHGSLGAEPYFDPELSPGERIGRPIRRNRRKLWFAVFLAIAFGGAWAVLGHPATWPVQSWAAWTAGKVSAVSAMLERKAPEPVERAALMAPSSAELTKPLPIETLPPAKAVSAPLEPDAQKGPMTTAAANKEAPEPLPPLNVDRADPYQVRAESIGLHPGLSRVLLTRLSDTDYRNAAHAIKTAVTETSDSAIFIWPRQRKPELAVFKVHFVPGAASDCRRYVVSITKDGWMTTALPMERCGPQLRQALRK